MRRHFAPCLLPLAVFVRTPGMRCRRSANTLVHGDGVLYYHRHTCSECRRHLQSFALGASIVA
eukprot:scaffold172334_cov26-Tisochrysis_lutea.AAC.1